MARRNSSRGGETAQLTLGPKGRAAVSVPAAAAFSFLREMRGVPTWSVGDMAKALKITRAEARQVLSVLEMQGYVQETGSDEYIATLSGEMVSGSKAPRYTVKRVEDALASLRERIVQNNKSDSPYRITSAVAFGDFLYDRSRAQAAEVGVALVRRSVGGAALSQAQELAAQGAFLKELRGGEAVLHLLSFEEWMKARNHRKLL